MKKQQVTTGLVADLPVITSGKTMLVDLFDNVTQKLTGEQVKVQIEQVIYNYTLEKIRNVQVKVLDACGIGIKEGTRTWVRPKYLHDLPTEAEIVQ